MIEREVTEGCRTYESWGLSELLEESGAVNHDVIVSFQLIMPHSIVSVSVISDGGLPEQLGAALVRR